MFNTFDSAPVESKIQEANSRSAWSKATKTNTEAEVLASMKKYGDDLQDYVFRTVDPDERDQRDVSDYEFIQFREFWGISKASCLARFPRVAEIPVYKYSKGTKNECCCIRGFKSVLKRGQLRWLMIGYNNIWYYSDSNCGPHKMSDNMMVDLSCKLILEKVTTRKVVIIIEMSRRTLEIQLPYYQGLYAFNSLVTAFRYSSYSCLHRFKSFAPPRDQNDCKLYVDGKGYFKDLADKLRKAKEEIMICGWMISPEFSLVRPVDKQHAAGENVKNDMNNLINILKERAYFGVRVYVLVYQEVSMQMYNDSLHCKTTLEALNHKNIKVLRHPTNFGQSLLWSHHEKMVIIDRCCVMMGGLDIAWGRWDTPSHDLFDFYDGCNFPGVDYYNAFKKDFIKGREFTKALVGKDKPRMPWHDVAMQLQGPIVFDFLTHFVTYWNNSREINQEEEVLFSQLSMTNPRFYISNSIKKILRGKVDGISVLEILLKDVPGKDSAPLKVTALASNVRDSTLNPTDIEPAVIKQKSIIDDQGKDALQKEVSLEYSRHNDGFVDMQLVRVENANGKNEFAGKYDENFLKELDEKFDLIHFANKLEEGSVAVNLISRLPQVNTMASSPLIGSNAELNMLPGRAENVPLSKSEEVPVTMHFMHIANTLAPTVSKRLDPSSLCPKKNRDEYLKYYADLVPTDGIEKEDVWSHHYPMHTAPMQRQNYNDDDPVLADIYQVPVEGLVRTTFKEEAPRPATVFTNNKFSAKGKMKMQALRSASFWSLGLTQVERSIQNCYIEMIANAQNYIYIENQFFISSTGSDNGTDDDIKNRIAKAIFERIKLAVKEGKNFKVIIFIPLLPAFEADLDKKEGDIMQVQIALQNQTLGSLERGLIKSVSAITDDVHKYIMICGLRKHQFPPMPKRTKGLSSSITYITDDLKKDDTKATDTKSALKDSKQPQEAQTPIHEPTHEEDKTKDPSTELIYIHSKVSFRLPS